MKHWKFYSAIYTVSFIIVAIISIILEEEFHFNGRPLFLITMVLPITAPLLVYILRNAPPKKK